jgi:hypothetical protein
MAHKSHGEFFKELVLHGDRQNPPAPSTAPGDFSFAIWLLLHHFPTEIFFDPEIPSPAIRTI